MIFSVSAERPLSDGSSPCSPCSSSTSDEPSVGSGKMRDQLSCRRRLFTTRLLLPIFIFETTPRLFFAENVAFLQIADHGREPHGHMADQSSRGYDSALRIEEDRAGFSGIICVDLNHHVRVTANVSFRRMRTARIRDVDQVDLGRLRLEIAYAARRFPPSLSIQFRVI